MKYYSIWLDTSIPRWCQLKHVFILHPENRRNDSQFFRAYFFRWVVQPPTRIPLSLGCWIVVGRYVVRRCCACWCLLDSLECIPACLVHPSSWYVCFFANIMSPKRNRSDGQVVDFTSRLHMQNAICHGFLVYFYKLHLVQDYLKKHIPKNLLGGFLPGFKSWLHFHPDPWGRWTHPIWLATS